MNLPAEFFLIFFPLLALAALGWGFFQGRKSDSEPAQWSRTGWIAIVSLAVLCTVFAFVPATVSLASSERWGLVALGLIGGGLIGQITGKASSAVVGVAALAVVGCGFHLTHNVSQPAQMMVAWGGMAGGLGLSSLLLGKRSLPVELAATVTLVIAGLAFFGRTSDIVSTFKAPSMLCLTIATVAMGIHAGFQSVTETDQRRLMSIVMIPVVGLCFFIGGQRLMQSYELAVLASISVVLAAMLAWVLPEDQYDNPAPAVLASVVWILLGTYARSAGEGFALGLICLAGFTGSWVFGSRRATLTMGPLVFIFLHATIQSAYPQMGRGIDISPYYAAIGLCLGILGPIASGLTTTTLSRIFGGLAMAVFGSVCPVLLGAKGAAGLVMGIGIGVLFGSMDRRQPALNLLGGASIFAGTLLAFLPNLIEKLDLTRASKMQAVGGGLILVAVMVAVAAAFELRTKMTPQPEATV